MAKPKTKSVQIGIDLHAALSSIAAERSAAGRRVTLRDIVEEAIGKMYPDLQVPAAAVDVINGNGDVDTGAEFQAILSAAFGGGSISGSVVGHFGQVVRRQDLADYMRTQMPPVSTLDELLVVFEQAVRP